MPETERMILIVNIYEALLYISEKGTGRAKQLC